MYFIQDREELEQYLGISIRSVCGFIYRNYNIMCEKNYWQKSD